MFEEFFQGVKRSGLIGLIFILAGLLVIFGWMRRN